MKREKNTGISKDWRNDIAKELLRWILKTNIDVITFHRMFVEKVWKICKVKYYGNISTNRKM